MNISFLQFYVDYQHFVYFCTGYPISSQPFAWNSGSLMCIIIIMICITIFQHLKRIHLIAMGRVIKICMSTTFPKDNHIAGAWITIWEPFKMHCFKSTFPLRSFWSFFDFHFFATYCHCTGPNNMVTLLKIKQAFIMIGLGVFHKYPSE